MTVTTQHDGDDGVRRSVLPGGLRIVDRVTARGPLGGHRHLGQCGLPR